MEDELCVPATRVNFSVQTQMTGAAVRTGPVVIASSFWRAPNDGNLKAAL
jgi:hypothetical protein